MRFIDYTDPTSFSSKLRKRRIRYLADLIKQISVDENLEKRNIRICDIGGTGAFWLIFPFAEFSGIEFEIDLYNLDYRGDDEDIVLPSNVKVTRLIGDACNLADIKDDSYHLCHSNSVIEHVGDWPSIARMAKESLRVAKYHYVQTPNFWFPIEPHFLIPFYAVFPRPFRIRLQEWLRKRSFPEEAVSADESVRLLTKRELCYLFPYSNLRRERFFFFTKSFTVSGASDSKG